MGRKKLIAMGIVIACIVGGVGVGTYVYETSTSNVNAQQIIKKADYAQSSLTTNTQDNSSSQSVSTSNQVQSQTGSSVTLVENNTDSSATEQTESQSQYTKPTVMKMANQKMYTTTKTTGYKVDGYIENIAYTNVVGGIVYDTGKVIQLGNFGGMYQVGESSIYIYKTPNANGTKVAKVTEGYSLYVDGIYGGDWMYVSAYQGSKEIKGFVYTKYMEYGETENGGSITVLS